MNLKKFFKRINTLVALISGFLPIVFIYIRKYLIDLGVVGNFKGVLMLVVLFALLILLLKTLVSLYKKYEQNYFIDFTRELDEKLVLEFSELPYELIEEYNERVNYNRAMNETIAYTTKYEKKFIIISQSVKMFGILIVFSIYDIKMTLFFILSLCIFGILEKYSIKKFANIWIDFQENMRRTNYFSQILYGKEYQDERKVFQTFKYFLNRFSKEYRDAYLKNKKIGRSRFVIDIIRRIIQISFWLFFILRMIPYLKANIISIGLFSSLFYSLIDFINTQESLMNDIFEFRLANKKIEDLENYFKHIKESKEVIVDNKEILSTINTIEFRDVYFKYPNTDKTILNGVNFKLDINLGYDYALVGENGSGKSTITKLLSLLYVPTSGKILINGKAIQEYEKLSIRKAIGYVAQDSYHYPITIKENLLLGNEEGEIDTELLKELKLLEKIENLPHDYNTELGIVNDSSISISGGEWQKLSIARTLQKDASFYILDEPNAKLDPILEARLYAYYKEHLKTKLNLMISHRLGATKSFTNILVLKDGKIISMGSHDILIKNDLYYRELYNTQKSLYGGFHEEKLCDI